MKIGKIVKKIKKRIEELEEIARGSELYWEQEIYSDEYYWIFLMRNYNYDERGFYLLIDKDNENVELKELPEHVLEEVLEILEDSVLEEAIEETVHED